VTWLPTDSGGRPLDPGDYPYTLTAGPGFRPVRDVVSLGSAATFDTYLMIGNPATDTAHVSLLLSSPSGRVNQYSTEVPAGSRRTIFVNDLVNGVEFSSHISSTIGVIAERSSYFNYKNAIKGGSNTVGATSPQKTWYFAEGYTSPGFEEYLSIENPGLSPTVASIDYMFPGGGAQHRDIVLPATSRTTVFVNQDVGPGREVSVRITATKPIVAERPMYYLTDRWKGGDSVIGVSQPSSTWYFAEGYTGEGFDEFLTLQNPSLTPTAYTVTYMDAAGGVLTTAHSMPGLARDTVDVRREAGPDKEVSIRVDSAVPLVAERPMYFTFQGRIRDGHSSTGVAAPATRFYFAEGFTGAGFEEYYTVLNPGDAPAGVTFRYLLETGPPVVTSHIVAPHSRATFDVSLEAGRDHQVSAQVDATAPVVVERPMYFLYYGVWDGGHVSTGAPQLSRDWYFPEGFTG
jgi:hypothetical protein